MEKNQKRDSQHRCPLPRFAWSIKIYHIIAVIFYGFIVVHSTNWNQAVLFITLLAFSRSILFIFSIQILWTCRLILNLYKWIFLT